MKFAEFLKTKGLDEASFATKTSSEQGALISEFNDAKFKALNDAIEAQKNESEDLKRKNAALETSMKAQGEALANVSKTSKTAGKTVYQKFKEDVESKLDKLKEIKANGSGALSFEIKAAGVTGTVAIAPGSASLTNGQSAASSLAEGGEIAYILQRVKPSVLDFVSSNTTNSRHITFRNEVVAEGDFAVTAEGVAKPLRQYKFAKASSDAVKIAAHTIITDEFEMDHPRLWALIQQLMTEDCDIAIGNKIMTDMITNASPYSLNALDDLVDSADNYAAIGAVVCQLQLLGWTPNVLALNPADAWQMKLTKDTTGQYIMPPFTWNGNTYEFGAVYVDPTVTAGNFFLGDATQYKVEFVGDIIVRMGYINDQLITNEMTLVVERYLHNYIPSARRAGFVYANFATVIADIEKP